MVKGIHTFKFNPTDDFVIDYQTESIQKETSQGSPQQKKKVSKFRISAGVWDWSVSLNERKNNERAIMKNRWTSGRNTELSWLNDIHTNSRSSFCILLFVHPA